MTGWPGLKKILKQLLNFGGSSDSCGFVAIDIVVVVAYVIRLPTMPLHVQRGNLSVSIGTFNTTKAASFKMLFTFLNHLIRNSEKI